MSKVIRWSSPRAPPRRWAALRPPAGPDNNRFTARPAAWSAATVPPLDCMMVSGDGAVCVFRRLM